MKQQTQELIFGNRSKESNHEGKLLLLCDGACKIVFAHGDHSIFQTRMQDLRNRHLFELGFSQHSLRKLAQEAEGGLMQVPRRLKKFSLELVKSAPKCNKDVFYRNIHIYLSKLEFTCTLTRVKFTRRPIRERICQIKRLPLTLMDKVEGEKFLTLVEIVVEPMMYYSSTSYEDYCLTLQRMQEAKERRRKDQAAEKVKAEYKPIVKIEEE